MRYPALLLALIAALCFCHIGGCKEKQQDNPPVAKPELPIADPVVEPPEVMDPVAMAEAKLAAAKKALEAAQKGSDELAKLKAERDYALAAKARADAITEQAISQSKKWQGIVEKKDKEIAAERQHMAQVKLYWIAGILGLLAIAATVVALWQPVVRKLAGGFAAACAGTAALCLFVAAILPYAIYIGAALGTIGVIAVLVWWRRDHKSLTQTVQAVNKAKEMIPAFKDSYKGVFNAVIDSDVDTHLNTVRSLLTKQALAAEVRALKAKAAALVQKV